VVADSTQTLLCTYLSAVLLVDASTSQREVIQLGVTRGPHD
jgi:hypothetical protein